MATGTVAEVLSPESERMVAFLVANGEPAETAAMKLGVPVKLAKEFIESAAGSELIVKMQSALFPDPVTRVRKMANLAVDTMSQILMRGDVKPDLKFRAAVDVMDRAMGKAVQVHESRSLVVNVDSLEAADRALAAQQERLTRLEEMQKKLMASRKRPAA